MTKGSRERRCGAAIARTSPTNWGRYKVKQEKRSRRCASSVEGSSLIMTHAERVASWMDLLTDSVFSSRVARLRL